MTCAIICKSEFPGLLNGTWNGLTQLKHKKCEDYSTSDAADKLCLARASAFSKGGWEPGRQVILRVNHRPQRGKALAPAGEKMDMITPLKVRTGPGGQGRGCASSCTRAANVSLSPWPTLSFPVTLSTSCLLTLNPRFSFQLLIYFSAIWQVISPYYHIGNKENDI